MKKQYDFATWLRAAATVSILLCHFTQESSSALLNMSAQFFNIGVELFIILSGFLFGVRGGMDAKSWYKKRLKRIFVPYEIFVILLFAVHAVCGRNLMKADWLWLAVGLQGSVVGILGAEQTWFITPLLLCYAVTPLLDRFFCPEREPRQAKAFLLAAAALPLLWAVPESPVFSTLLPLVSYYAIAFAVGRGFSKMRLTTKGAGAAFFIMLAAFAARLAGRYLCDGTILYERLICGYTQAVAAFCIFYLFAVVFEKIRPTAAVQRFSEISFEVYLVHYMFCVGPVRLFAVTPYWVVNCILVTIVSVLLAAAIHKLAGIVLKNMKKICP